MKPDQANNVNEKISKEDEEKCVHCQQLYIKRWMNRHTKSGKCEKYSPFIEFTTVWLHCKLCLKSKTDRPNVHVLYKHLENKHKSEISTKEIQGNGLGDNCTDLNNVKGKRMYNYEKVGQSKTNKISNEKQITVFTSQVAPVPEDQSHKIVKMGPKSKMGPKCKMGPKSKMGPKCKMSPKSKIGPQPSNKPKSLKLPISLTMGPKRNKYPRSYLALFEDQEQAKPIEAQSKLDDCRENLSENLLKRHIGKCNTSLKQGDNTEMIHIFDDEINVCLFDEIDIKQKEPNIAKICEKKSTLVKFEPFIESTQSITNLEWNKIDNSLALPDPKPQHPDHKPKNSDPKPQNLYPEPQNPDLKPPFVVEFYSCPMSDPQKRCPKYETEEKVRQHITSFHNISMEYQLQLFKKIQNKYCYD